MKKLLKRARTWVVFLSAAAVIAAACLYWFVWRTPEATASTSGSQTVTATATSTTFEKSVSATGTIAPAVNETVNFAAAGTVLSVDVAAGDTVTEGQQLATIDTLQLNATLQEARANLAVLQTQLAAAEDDSDGSEAALAKIASLEAQVAVAQQQVTDAEAAMGDAVLTAPVAGLVTAASLHVGDKVTANSSTAQFTIVSTDAWTTTVHVDDADIANVSVGDQVELTFDSLSNTVFGVVTSVGLIASSQGGTARFPVDIAVTGSPEGLHDGMSATVAIVYSRRLDVLTIPTAAMRTTDGASVVDVVGADGSTTETTIEIGEQSGDQTEVLSGLSEGDEVQYTIAIATPNGSNSSGNGPNIITGPDGQSFQLPDGIQPGQGFVQNFQGGPNGG